MLSITDIISDAKASKDKNLISTITALKGKVKEIKTHGINTDFCDDELNACFMEQFHVIIIKQL